MILNVLRILICGFYFIFDVEASIPLSEMSVEEKVGQVLMVHFHGECANEEARFLIQELHVGGIIYYNWANGLESPQQVRNLSAGLQHLALRDHNRIPLLIAVDQEGGLISRIKGLTEFPGNFALGVTRNPDLAESSSYVIGKELRAVGVNMNLAPVVDINNQPRNPVIGIRSFGDSSAIVTEFAKQAIKGYHRAGMIISLKHFPGHGDVVMDSHEDLPIVNKSIDQLKKLELMPFFKLASQADTIMTAHLLVPALDHKRCATLSSKILGFLRDEIRFDGVIISDSLVMAGVLKGCESIDDAAIDAFNAGCDILLLGGKQMTGSISEELRMEDIKRIHQHLVQSVCIGRISEKRLDQAVERILKLKERYPLLTEFEEPDMFRLINTSEHRSLAKIIADQSVILLKNELTIDEASKDPKIVLLAPLIISKALTSVPFHQYFPAVPVFFDEADCKITVELKEMTQEADLVIVFSYNAWKHPLQASMIKSLIDQGKEVIVVAARDPLDASLFPGAKCIILSNGPTQPSIQAAVERIQKALQQKKSLFP